MIICLNDFPVFSLNNIWTDVESVQSRTDPKVYRERRARIKRGRFQR
jgi:hypothetical protein